MLHKNSRVKIYVVNKEDNILCLCRKQQVLRGIMWAGHLSGRPLMRISPDAVSRYGVVGF